MDEIRRLFRELQVRLEALEKGLVIKKITIPTDTSGFFVPKIVSTDPVSPVNNEVWINTTDNKLKWNKAGTVKTVTLT